MKKIPVICNLNFHTSIGGTQRTLAMALSMVAQNYDVRVIDPYKNLDFCKLMLDIGLSVETIIDLSDQTHLSFHNNWRKMLDYSSVIPRYLHAALELRRYFTKNHADIIYVNQTKSAAMAILATPNAVPIIFHCHDAETTGIRLIARLHPRLAMVIANSAYTGRQLIQIGFPPDKIRVIANAVDVNEIRALAKQDPIQPLPAYQGVPRILLAHSGIDPNKGTLEAVEAFGNLVQKGLAGELWIAGDIAFAQQIYAEHIKLRIQEMKITNCVHFLGRRSDIYTVMANVDIVLVPTIYKEHFGRVAVEAMALGKTVIVSNRGALPDVVRDRVTGRVFNVECSGELEQVIAEVLSDATALTQYEQAGPAWVYEHFRPEEFNHQLFKVFSEVLAN